MAVSIDYIKEALLIRRVEETLLSLFSLGKLNGTVHTCIGQEFSAVSFANQLQKGDFIFSNHRCHGHYISFTKDYRGLLLELTGKKEGVCGGIGGSQHLCNNNFYSNGIQGGIVPVAAGLALSKKLMGLRNIGLVFIGDGTLGEGVVYETLNIISKWGIPLLIVCENNLYAQSTKIENTLAGNILQRAEAFGIKTFESNTEQFEHLPSLARESIEYVRENCKPAFHLVNTYRLNAHSKGDDDRDKSEVEYYMKKDPINVFAENNPVVYNSLLDEVNSDITIVINELDKIPDSDFKEYIRNTTIRRDNFQWVELDTINERLVNLINRFFNEEMEKNNKILFIGEDVLSPYGGAFKVAKDLSHKFRSQVFTTPISEASIVGISNGLALGGFKPFAELMFGDFVTLAMDQIINHSSKFYHMYNKKVTCPVVIRTPMGGGRGYGPTHSQTLDKFLVGIDNVTTVALNSLISPKIIYESVLKEEHPVIIIENKLDYGRTIAKKRITNYSFLRTTSNYPLIKLSPKDADADYTIITYGGNVTNVLEAVEKLFFDNELIGEAFVLTKISPLDTDQMNEIIKSVKKTKSVFIVEEGSSFAGIGSEIIANIVENINEKIFAKRIASLAIPIPSAFNLEREVLVNVDSIIDTIKNKLHERSR